MRVHVSSREDFRFGGGGPRTTTSLSSRSARGIHQRLVLVEDSVLVPSEVHCDVPLRIAARCRRSAPPRLTALSSSSPPGLRDAHVFLQQAPRLETERDPWWEGGSDTCKSTLSSFGIHELIVNTNYF